MATRKRKQSDKNADAVQKASALDGLVKVRMEIVDHRHLRKEVRITREELDALVASFTQGDNVADQHLGDWMSGAEEVDGNYEDARVYLVDKNGKMVGELTEEGVRTYEKKR